MKHLRLIPITLFIAAAIMLFNGGIIQAKAIMAQYLLGYAWTRSIAAQTAQKPWPWADSRAIARLSVPSENLDMIVLDGGSGEAMAFGPTLFSTQGKARARIIGGHRDTHLRFLKNLNPGDSIVVTELDGTVNRYALRTSLIANIHDHNLLVDPEQSALILITCYPFDALPAGGPLRYIAIATPLSLSESASLRAWL